MVLLWGQLGAAAAQLTCARGRDICMCVGGHDDAVKLDMNFDTVYYVACDCSDSPCPAVATKRYGKFIFLAPL